MPTKRATPSGAARQGWRPPVSVAVVIVLCAFGAGAAPAQDRASPPVPVADQADTAAIHILRNETEKAIVSYTAALADTAMSNDRRATLLSDRGVAYARAGQIRMAIEDFNAAARLFPEYAAVYNNRGNLLVSLGLLKEAEKDLDRAVVLAPGFAAAYNNRAALYVKVGRLGDAIGDYTKAILLSPQNPAPFSGRGRAHLALNRPHAAVRDFTRAVSADAQFAQGYRNRAEAKLVVGAYGEAIEDLSRAIAFDVSNPEIYVIRGDAYLAAGDISAALRDFNQAIALDAGLLAAYTGRGLAHARMAALEEAFVDLNRAIDLDPRSAVAFAVRAFIYKETGQIAVGSRDIETALKLDENRAEVYWARGELREAMGKVAEAIADFERALVLRPGYRDASDGLQRLGAGAQLSGERIVKGSEIAGWRVVERAGQFFALSDDFSRLSIPLEMLGNGTPKLIDWEVKEAPNDGFGVLRFSGGALVATSGSVPTEMIALVDLPRERVLAITPQREGNKVSKWTWEEGRVSVAALDGLTEEFEIRSTINPALVAGGAAAAGASVRRFSTGANKPYSTGWAPWDEPMAATGTPSGAGAKAKRPSQKKRKKPKTLFELLFN